MANPQHDTRTTVLEITYTRYVENQIIIAPFFPVKYRFSPMTQEQLQSIDPEEKGDGLGYFILSPPTGAGISGIKYITRDLDMMDIKTPQWPYVFASATAENETYVDRATTKLVAFVRIAQALGKPGVVGAPLEQITCGRFDGVWEMDHQKYLHWEKVLRTVL